MAYIVGYVTKEEKAELERRGWEVEPAEEYDLVGLEPRLLAGERRRKAVVIFVDVSVFDVMSGPDWDEGNDQ